MLFSALPFPFLPSKGFSKVDTAIALPTSGFHASLEPRSGSRKVGD